MNRRTNFRIALALVLAAAPALHGCGDDRRPETDGSADPTLSSGADRPATRTDTIRIEGMHEEIALRLFSAPDAFPLPFTAYVPDDMAAEADPEGTVQFTAEFGGQRSADAFVHLLVYPDGTDRQVALATARAYKTGRGVPVSQGLQPIADELRPPHLDWAIEAYRFRYQGEGGWYVGTLGVGRHGSRYFQLVRHYPAEYGDGFAPRTEPILETWRWADGTGLSARRSTPSPSPDGPATATAPDDSIARP